jgi:hypothetical protein
VQTRIAGLSGSIACLLLGANLTLLLVRPNEPRAALGQAAATPDGTAILATVQGSGNEPYFVVYDVVSKRAGAYAIKTGIELRGIRELTWDFELQELATDKSIPVAQIRAEVEKQKKAAAKQKP